MINVFMFKQKCNYHISLYQDKSYKKNNIIKHMTHSTSAHTLTLNHFDQLYTVYLMF